MVAGQHRSSICRSFFQKCFIISEFDRMNSRNQFFVPTDSVIIGVQKIKTSQPRYVSIFVNDRQLWLYFH